MATEQERRKLTIDTLLSSGLLSERGIIDGPLSLDPLEAAAIADRLVRVGAIPSSPPAALDTLQEAIPLLAAIRYGLADEAMSEQDRLTVAQHALQRLWVQLCDVERALTPEEQPEEGDEP